MAFNAKTYRANKARKDAWKSLAVARDIKARAARGEAYDWELPRVAVFVREARFHMHSHLRWAYIAELSKSH